jgi:hypothetical protein
MPELSEKIISRVEKKFEKGENHFVARGVMASIALALSDPGVRQDILLDSNERIVRFLQDRDAAGEVYALREDLGNGAQDSTDYVRVTSRNGVNTNVSRNETSGEAVIRMTTADIDY